MQDHRREIEEVVLRYCRGVDRADLELVRSAYHPDAVEHHPGFDGTFAEYMIWLETTIAKYDGLMHIVGNHLSTVKGDRAVAETYAMGVHWAGAIDDERNFTSGIRYIDRMERRASRWAIAERWVLREWVRSEVNLFVPPGDVPRGTRDDSDELCRSLEWLD